MNITKRLSQILKAKDISVYRLCKLAGLSAPTVYGWYNKGSQPSLQNLEIICEALGITLSDFFWEEADDEEQTKEEKMIHGFRLLSEHNKVLVMSVVDLLNRS